MDGEYQNADREREERTKIRLVWRASGQPPLGAKLGAIRCGQPWTSVDGCGTETKPFRPVWTPVDGCGRRL